MKITHKLTFWLLLLCAQWASAQSVFLAPNSEVMTDYADRLYVSGAVQVNLLVSGKETRVLNQSGQGRVNQLQINWKDNQLRIELPDEASVSEPLRLSVYLPALHGLTAVNGSTVYAENLHAKQLAIQAETGSTVELTGELEVTSLYANSAEVNLYWLMGNELNVQAKNNSQLFLSGKIDTLEANVTNESYLNARYLNVRRAYANSHDRARITLAVTDILNAQAHDTSDIDYFRRPEVLSVHMEDQGSVLDWTDLEVAE